MEYTPKMGASGGVCVTNRSSMGPGMPDGSLSRAIEEDDIKVGEVQDIAVVCYDALLLVLSSSVVLLHDKKRNAAIQYQAWKMYIYKYEV